MVKLLNILILFSVTFFFACDETATTQNGNGTTGQPPVDTSEQKIDVDSNITTRPDCQIIGTMLEENIFWAKSENLIVAIIADDETQDPELGESHRILELYDGNNCERVFRKVLPVNISPDYAYYLSEITYNNLSKVIAVRGFDEVYILDLAEKKLSPSLEPGFLNERFEEDAQSGLIQRLEIWENYLVGYATGKGTFVFDLDTPMAAKAILPAAEYEISEGTDYHSMFFLKSNGRGDVYQAIQPIFDLNTGEFRINPLFEKPLNIQTNINRSFRDNQYLVLKELLGGTKSRPIGIDMKAMKRVEIPPDVASKKDTDIIKWMKSQ